jgi:mono/diheme cytochrome c family protein
MKPHLLGWPIAFTVVLLGCGHRPEQYLAPDEVTDFAALYGSNCAACHGLDGRSGGARPLNDSLFLELIGKDRLREVIAKGVPHTAMPPFADKEGGTLTDRQVAILADGMGSRWSHAGEPAGTVLPAYSADLGDRKRGEIVFQEYCARCHGASGAGGPNGSVVDPAFLALTSDQSLRTTVIAGRIDRAAPDWRGNIPGRVMTAEEIGDVVAWLSAHRVTANIVAKGGTNQP